MHLGFEDGFRRRKNSKEVSGVLEKTVEVIDHSLCMLSCVPTLL